MATMDSALEYRKKVSFFLWRKEAVSSCVCFWSTSAAMGHCVGDRRKQGGKRGRAWCSISMAATRFPLSFLLSREREKNEGRRTKEKGGEERD